MTRNGKGPHDTAMANHRVAQKKKLTRQPMRSSQVHTNSSYTQKKELKELLSRKVLLFLSCSRQLSVMVSYKIFLNHQLLSFNTERHFLTNTPFTRTETWATPVYVCMFFGLESLEEPPQWENMQIPHTQNQGTETRPPEVCGNRTNHCTSHTTETINIFNCQF